MNTKYTLVAASLLIAIATSANAQKPTYDEARRLYNQFDKTLSAVGLWGKKQQPERVQALQNAMQLRARLTKIMGNFSQCANASAAHVEFISNINAIGSAAEGGSQVTPFQLMMTMAMAERFGNSRNACYDEVEALDTPKKK